METSLGDCVVSPRLSRLSRETLKECLVSLRSMQVVLHYISLFGHVYDGLDVRAPSICYECILSPLVNKEPALANGRAEYSRVGNPSRDREGKKTRQRRHVITQEARGNKPQTSW